ncbi:MAG: hypothetical protein ACI4SG_05280 [Oligosphaeraceae bacterium]
MSKNGKIIGVAALVLAIAAVTFAVFSLKQAKAHARRYQELADAVTSLARVLDSGSGVDSRVTFSVDDGKENGSLGWTATKGLPGATESAVAPLNELAEKVIEQRETIINAMVEKVAKPLNCPASKSPQPTILNNVDEYSTGMDGFAAYIRARANRDRNLQQKINEVLYSLDVRSRFQGEITEDGSFAAADAQVFRDAANNLKNLRANYTQTVNTLKELTTALRGVNVDGVTWETPKVVGNLNTRGLSETDSSNLKAAAEKFKADFQQLKIQLGRIDQLEDDKADLQNQLAEAQKKAAAMEAKWQTSEKALQDIMDSVTPGGKYSPNALTDISQMDEHLMGKVMEVNAKYGHVVVDLTQGEVVEGALFSVMRSGKYVGMVRIATPSPFNSLAYVEEGKAGDIRPGDTLLRASNILQSNMK